MFSKPRHCAELELAITLHEYQRLNEACMTINDQLRKASRNANFFAPTFQLSY